VLMDVLAQAIDKAKSTKPGDVRNALSSTRFTEGWTKAMTGGAVKFDETGLNTLAEPVMVQWQRNELVTVWPEKYAKGKVVLREKTN
jgi:branched-chain amino acid transport system substrate-binding protein